MKISLHELSDEVVLEMVFFCHHQLISDELLNQDHSSVVNPSFLIVQVSFGEFRFVLLLLFNIHSLFYGKFQ